MSPPHRYRVYGIVLHSDHPLPWLQDVRVDASVDAPTARPGSGDQSAQVSFRLVHAPLPEPLAAQLGSGIPIEGDDANDAPITFHPTTAGTVVRFQGAADHLVTDSHITGYLPDPQLAPLVQVQLLGTVLALWLELRGVVTLHAAVVEVDGRGIALLGAPGGGKTTLATALVADGARFVVDDLAALDHHGPRVLVQPGYPTLRLWPDQVEQFTGGVDGLGTVHPWYDKRVVSVGRHLKARHVSSAVPLAYVLVPRRGSADQTLEVQRLDPTAGLPALLANGFLPEPVHQLGLAGSRLRPLVRLLSEVPIATLRYPTGFARLPEVLAAIRAGVPTR